MSGGKFDDTKLREAILYIASLIPPEQLGKTKLFKILFFSDFSYFKLHRESITGERYIHRENGPVPSHNYIVDKMKNNEIEIVKMKKGDFVQQSIKSNRKPNLALFKPEEHEVIKKTSKQISPLTGKKITEITHELDLWKQTRINEYIPYALLFNDENDDMSDGGFTEDEEILVHSQSFKSAINKICLNGQ